MKQRTPIVIALLLCVASSAQAEGEWRKGVLLYYVNDEGELAGEPGMVVRFRDLSQLKVEIEIDKDTVVEDFPYLAIPYDPKFTPERVYLRLLIWKQEQPHCYQKPMPLLARFHLARNVAKEFPKHPLHEEILAMACDFSYDYEGYVSDGKTLWKDTISLIDEYLIKYPKGRYKDRLEWKNVELQNATYEYEGHAELPLKEIKAFNKYLRSRPDTTEKHEILLRLAMLHRIVYECVKFARRERQKAGLTEKDAEQHLKKAVRIYKKLIYSKDLEVCYAARVALYNIGEERRTYAGLPKDW